MTGRSCTEFHITQERNRVGQRFSKALEAHGVKIIPKWLFKSRQQEKMESYGTKSFSLLQNHRRGG